jgi:dTDP-4-amino-4,6-dideoxygalactose transaminase
MRKEFLPFSPPSIGQEEVEEVVDTLRSDWITTGPKVKRFEDEFAAFVSRSTHARPPFTSRSRRSAWGRAMTWSRLP